MSELDHAKLERLRRAARAHLAQALLHATDAPNQGGDDLLAEHNLYLEHNELEMALDQLEEFGERNKCSKEFWRALELAAGTMTLTERANYYHHRQQETQEA